MHLIEELLELIEADLEALGIDVDGPWRSVRAERVRYRKSGTDLQRILAGGTSRDTQKAFLKLLDTTDTAFRKAIKLASKTEFASTLKSLLKEYETSKKLLLKHINKRGLTLRHMERVMLEYHRHASKLKTKPSRKTDVVYLASMVTMFAGIVGIFGPAIGGLTGAVALSVMGGGFATAFTGLGGVLWGTNKDIDKGSVDSALSNIDSAFKRLSKSLKQDESTLDGFKQGKMAAKGVPVGSWAGLKSGTDLGHVDAPSSRYRKKQKA